MRPSLDRAHDKLDRLLLVEASDSASLLASFRVLRCRIVNSGLVSRKCWLRTRRVSDEVNGRLRSSPFDLASALLPHQGFSDSYPHSSACSTPWL